MQRVLGFRSSLIFFVLINIAWLGLVALWIYYSVNNYQIIRRISLNFQFGPAGMGPPWIVWFGAGILMLFLLLGIIVIYTYYRKQAGLNLLHQNFISSVTHELKSPLASLQLYLETLALRDPPAPDRTAFLQRMQEDTERLSTLIHNILLVSQLQRLKIEYAFEWTPLDERLASYLEEKKRKHGWEAAQLIVRLSPGVRVRLDWDNFKVALDNVVENAIRYSPDRFWLKVGLQVEGEACVLSFEDKGVGIPREEQGNIFRIFYRIGRRPPDRVVQGTGLGLYIANSIVQAHGGKIQLRSDGADKGTTFFIRLPLSGVPPKHRQRPEFWMPSLPFRSHERAQHKNSPRGG
ncbi:MAG: ATP-binding protein [bacterium]